MGWITLALDILTGLPSLITSIEAAFMHHPKSGAQKWIAIESALSEAITTVAADIVKDSPSKRGDEIAAHVSKWVKIVNDATVALYNGVGWPAPLNPPPK